ncbi:uncharacterized protein LOC113317593 [Papaver somniferum]|uniref:uncharacterized protein LOC113317593 n=1 Tax=Papaver somniferum TaxID=3469 RepID=UPI000E703BC0|nr:uncharacterized protein LOC113317593 [Papaver somniferum]
MEILRGMTSIHDAFNNRYVYSDEDFQRHFLMPQHLVIRIIGEVYQVHLLKKDKLLLVNPKFIGFENKICIVFLGVHSRRYCMYTTLQRVCRVPSNNYETEILSDAFFFWCANTGNIQFI